MLSTAGSIHGHSFAPKLMGQQERGGHLFRCCRGRQVDRLRHAAVAVPLKNRLHPNMVIGGDIVGRHKQPTKVGWNPGEVLNGFVTTDLLTQFSER